MILREFSLNPPNSNGSAGLWRIGWPVLCSALAMAAQAQTDYLNMIRTAPYPAYREPERMQYNLKWGRAIGRFRGSLLAEYNDNITLAPEHADSDLFIEPLIGVGFLLPLSKMNILQLDLEAGYRYYAVHSDLNSVTISPNSRLDYRVIVKDVALHFHDLFAIQVDPVTRTELGGSTGQPSNFRRLHNVSGFLADWRMTRQAGLMAGYDYTMDRSLSDEFQSLDRNDHTFSGGTYYIVSPRWTAGLNAAYSVGQYLEKVQNNSETLSAGPFVNYKPSNFISIDGSVGYSQSIFDQSGTIADTSESSGLTFQIAARHRLNSRTSQVLRLSKGTQHGLGSNFTDLYVAQHNLNARLTRAINLTTSLTYERYAVSGDNGDEGDRFLFSVGAAYNLLKDWSLGVTYAFALKESSLEGNGYAQNRLALNATRKF